MAKAYSADMRGRVIAEVEGGASRREAAEGFEVSASTAGQSASRRADPCSALDCETTNGSGSRIFCLAEKVMSEAPQRTTDCSSMQFFIGIEPEFPGVTCRRVSATGRSYISATADGQKPEFSSEFSSFWRATPLTNT